MACQARRAEKRAVEGAHGAFDRFFVDEERDVDLGPAVRDQPHGEPGFLEGAEDLGRGAHALADALADDADLGQVALDDTGAVMDPGELLDQTRRTMEFIRRVLAEFGLTMDEMVKQNAFYKGEAGPDVIVANQTLRSSYYAEPAGASTGIPLPFLALAEMMIEVEIIAMVR